MKSRNLTPLMIEKIMLSLMQNLLGQASLMRLRTLDSKSAARISSPVRANTSKNIGTRSHLLNKCFHAIAWSLAMHCGAAHAQYPSKNIEFVIPDIPSSSSWQTVQEFIPAFNRHLKNVELIAKPVPGKYGRVGHAYVRESPPDGYRMLMASLSTFAFPYALDDGFKSDFDQFEFIGLISHTAWVCVTDKDAPIRDWRVFLKQLKEHPESLRQSLGSIPGATMMVYLSRLLGVDYSKVIWVRPGESDSAVSPIEEKRADFTCGNAVSMEDFIREGRVVPIFSNNKIQMPNYPSIPSGADMGLPELGAMNTWVALAVVKGTPPEIVTSLKNTFKAMKRDPAWKQTRSARYQYKRVIRDPELGSFIKSQVEFYQNLAILVRASKREFQR